MSRYYLEHFKLRHEPFSKEISAADLWLPSRKQGAVDAVCDAIEARQNVMLVGEPGVGKTSVLRGVRHRLSSDQSIRFSYCHNATLGRRDFYRQLCMAMGVRSSATVGALFHAVSTHIVELGRDHMYPVVLLDEAHLLQQDTLEHLHILLNYEWDSRALLSLVLVGLPELRDRLSLRTNRSLYSRIQCRLEVEELCAEETREYVEYRLGQAGATGTLVDDTALIYLHEATGGSMRELDRVMTRALELAAHRKRKLVTRREIEAALAGVLPQLD